MTTVERIIPPKVAEDGSIHYASVMSPADSSVAVCHIVPNRVIPVIFVPGVMGSNLEDFSGKIVWDVSKSNSLVSWMLRGAATRKRILDPSRVVVSAQGKVPDGTNLPDEEKRRRGWTTVSNMYYGKFLAWLEGALNDCSEETGYGKNGLRKQLIGEFISAGLNPLAYDEVSLSHRYQMPVHAVGYNWLQSNAKSAQHLSEEIDKYVNYYRDKYRWKCEKVIIVTHSMGGLVARYCSEVIKGGQNKILGIVHGVMPATGAGTAYQHVRGGNQPPSTSSIKDWIFERAISRVLGATAIEVAPLFAQSPGALQLLPSMDYKMGWLKIRSGDKLVSLPQVDPYFEIYTNRGKWWSLINEDMLNVEDRKLRDKEWKKFAATINRDVLYFHALIAKKYHPNTYVFCGNDDSKRLKTWGDVVWKQVNCLGGHIPSCGHLLNKPAHKDDAVGEVVIEDAKLGEASDYRKFKIQPASDNGDGTVPAVSGLAPRPYVRALAAFKNVEHAGAFDVMKEVTQPQQFCLWGIVKILQKVKDTALAYPE
ncbi:hypothetical protein H0X90_31155 [Burkholderia sp. 9775_39]|uniref:esterase/lipase family protein n=1 Tax=unclassified Burkholderia TaxID=2613784 RepID=UPI0018C3B89D|nr:MULTISPECIES: hypothetical protein [unclassified Burkholderia]MBG0881267.1 hypothetical protein [Burkholderia sp. 9775_39]MBG0887656.1 hypothetical protein [Burkholderia sp. 9773_38]